MGGGGHRIVIFLSCHLYTITGWSWVDGSPLDYLHWADGQPSSSLFDSYQMCVEMQWSGHWNDVACSSRRKFICLRRINSMWYYKKGDILFVCFFFCLTNVDVISQLTVVVYDKIIFISSRFINPCALRVAFSLPTGSFWIRILLFPLIDRSEAYCFVMSVGLSIWLSFV